MKIGGEISIRGKRHRKNLRYIQDKNGCHVCISHKYDGYGYVQIWLNGKYIKAHRYVYELNYGPIPPDEIVLHKCDNPHCINPLHLQAGTHADNQKDKVNKNRQAKGEENGRSILSINDVRQIMADKVSTNVDLAAQYGVDHSTISKIRRGRNWTWVKPVSQPSASINEQKFVE